MREMNGKFALYRVTIVACAVTLGGCLSDDKPDTSGAESSNVRAGNSAPTISGAPPRAVTAGRDYSFRPTAYDADGDPLTFSADNLPAWAVLNSSNGLVTGIPTLGDTGMYRSITISVSDGSDTDQLGPFDIEVTAPNPGNNPPTISGIPPNEVTAGSNYVFRPAAIDIDGDPLTFSAENLPNWATLNSSNGLVTGVPDTGDVGMYSGITVSVSDGSETDRLGPFSIEVIAEGASLGSVTLSWTAPTENADGSTLTDLAGFRIYWGTQTGNYPNLIDPLNTGLTTTAGVTSYVVNDLAVGTYYFVATAVDSEGTESGFSGYATKVVQ